MARCSQCYIPKIAHNDKIKYKSRPSEEMIDTIVEIILMNPETKIFGLNELNHDVDKIGRMK